METKENLREYCHCGKSVNEFAPRLGKRLAYLLRYGALKEGLTVHPGGFVKLDDLLSVGLMRWHSKDEVLKEITFSKTVQGHSRFGHKYQGGEYFVRAVKGRNLEPPVRHADSVIPRLLELCFNYVIQNIKLFDLEDFPDEFLMSRLFFRLKHEKRLSNATMSCLLGRAMGCINFHGVFLTEGTFKILITRCPNLTTLELKSCGYVVTDKIVELICKNLRRIQKLNLCDCGSVTDKALTYPGKFKLYLEYLNISHIPKITFNGLKRFVHENPFLTTLHVQGNSNIGPLEVQILKTQGSRENPLEIFSECDKSCHALISIKRRTLKCACGNNVLAAINNT